MGKAALIAITAFTILGTYYTASSTRTMHEADRQVARHQYEVLARNAALAGYNRAKQALAEGFTSAPPSITGSYEDAAYSTEITWDGDVAKVTSTGTAGNVNGRAPHFKVVAEIEQEKKHTIADQPPAFMQYALLSEENLSLQGNVLSDVLSEVHVQGDDGNQLNANMHTNGSLNVTGNAVTVEGFGTYVNSVSGKHAADAFEPNDNPADEPTIQQSARVDIPPFDAALLASKVNVDRTEGSVELLGGELDLGGTRDDPYIWHVQGDLTLLSDVKISGYVLFIVEGNATLAGNVQAGASGYDGADESNIALYAGGNVELGGITHVSGQLYVGGNVVFMHGTPHVYGSIATLGMADLQGTPKIYYRPASPALTITFQDPIEHLRLISYTEW